MSKKYKLFGEYEFGTSTNTYLQKPTDTELSNLGLQRSGLYTESVRKFWKTEEALAYVESLINPPSTTTEAETGTETGTETETAPEYVISTSISDDGQGLITVSTRKE